MVAPPSRISTTLTGRARARPGFWGRQVLQVEVELERYTVLPPPPHRDPSTWDVRRPQGSPWLEWRDAMWSDVQQLGGLVATGGAFYPGPAPRGQRHG